MLQITINSSDISSHVVSFTREKDLCSSEGIVEFTLDGYATINPYAVIRVYENTILKGTFYTDFTEKMSDGTMTVHGRDNSKRAQDYYIAERFFTEGDTTSRYWIEFFLGLAGISYNFTTTDTGYIIQDGEMMGLTSCAEVVEMLVRYSGWFIYYDASNTAQIGKLDYDSSNYKKAFTDNDIITIVHLKSDQYLRNRAVVWGAGYTGSQEWVFADITVNTPWNYDSLDVRAILARAGFPVPFSQAIATANVLLNEYARLVEEKTITVHGYHNLEIGDFVLIQSKYYNGICLISAINTSAEDGGGYTTTLILDRRCPRFVGFYDVGGIVYAGTEEDGIWTKSLKGPHTWTDYSAGLSDLNIHDLDVSYGVMSTVTNTGYLYGRTVGDTAWIRLQPSYYYDTIGSGYYPASSGVYVASTVNDLDQALYGLYTISGDSPRAWITKYPSLLGGYQNIFVTYSGQNNYEGVDIEVTYEDIFVSVLEKRDTTVLSPFACNPLGQEVNFIGGMELNDVIVDDSWFKYQGITGNYIYAQNGTQIRQTNFRTLDQKYVTINSETQVYFIPVNEQIGYYFTYNNANYYKAYKVDWETLTFSLAEEYYYDPINEYGNPIGLLGAVRYEESTKVLLGLADTGKLGVLMFDCDTETFSIGDYIIGVSDEVSRDYFKGYQASYAVSDFVDIGNGKAGIYFYGAYTDIPDYLFIVDTNNITTEKYTTFSYDGRWRGDVWIAPNMQTGDLFIQLREKEEDNNYYFKIYKFSDSGTKSLVKRYNWDLYDEEYNFILAYNESDVISVHSNGVETIYYDCVTGADLGSHYLIEKEKFSQNLGSMDEMFAFCGTSAGIVDLVNYKIDQNRYSYYLVDNELTWRSGSQEPTFNKDTLVLAGEYIADRGDYYEVEDVYNVEMDSTTDALYDFMPYIDEHSLYRFVSDNYFTINVSTNPDSYSTGWALFRDGWVMLTDMPGWGKAGLGLEGMYASELYLYNIGIFDYWCPSTDGHYVEGFMCLSPNEPNVWRQDLTVSVGDRLNGGWGYRNDNEGTLGMTITKMGFSGESGVSVKFDLLENIKSWGSSYYLVRLSVADIQYDTDVRQIFIKVNGIKYYPFSYTTNDYATASIVATIGFTMSALEVGYDVFPIPGEFSFRISSLKIVTIPYTIDCIEKITAGGYRIEFRTTDHIESWEELSPNYIRAIGNYLAYPKTSWLSSNGTEDLILHTYDNNYKKKIGKIFKYSNNEFEEIYSLNAARFNLDISNPSVITAYTRVSTSGIIYLDGEPYETGSSRGDLWFSFTGLPRSFKHVNLPTMSGSYIYDSRSFTLVSGDEYRTCIGFVVLSGLFGSVGQFSYIDVTEYEEFGGTIVFPDIYTVESFNTAPVALETSNYSHMYTPYFLVGLSGTTNSGVDGPFFQRDLDTDIFIDRSDNFPPSRITTIRLDDMI